MDFRYIQLIIVALVNALGLILAVGIFSSNIQSRINRLFALLTLSALLWVDFGYAGDYLLNGSSLFFKRLNFATVPFFFVVAYFFSTVFPQEAKDQKWVHYPLVIFGASFSLISAFSGLVIKEIHVQPWGVDIIGGSFILAFYIWTFLTTCLIISSLFRDYSALGKVAKSKISYFLVGTILFAFMNVIFNIVLPTVRGTTQYYQFGDYSIILFLIFTALAITKRGLFDVRMIATETTVIILSLVLFLQIFGSGTITEKLVSILIWLLATYSGYALIKSVKKEIEQKEHIQKLADELKVANEKLKELDEQKDNFISMASHELNTPIAAIEGYLSMILDEKMGGEIPEKAKRYLDSVYSSSKRLAALVRDLLNVSRIESNRIHIIYEEAQIESVIEQALMEVDSKVREANHTLNYEKPATPIPKTWFDVPRITEVVINLLGNSIKYTNPGGKIEVKVVHDDKFITVSVADNGKGIPKEKSGHIFEKFSQVDVMKDEIKGTGLGLFISKNLVELQGGKIWFESEGEGKGTTFFFTVPILKDKPADAHEGEGAVLKLK